MNNKEYRGICLNCGGEFTEHEHSNEAGGRWYKKSIGTKRLYHPSTANIWPWLALLTIIIFFIGPTETNEIKQKLNTVLLVSAMLFFVIMSELYGIKNEREAKEINQVKSR